MAAKKYYVVWVGHRPGIYTTWSEAEKQVRGFPG
ncbi:MAG: viroplasmin and RNaseH domain-containing protein, partial [Halieaceae bacterium]